MELEGRRTSQLTRKLMKKKDLKARSSIAGTVEQDMAQGNVLHMAKHVTIVREEIPSRVYADHRKKSMDWAESNNWLNPICRSLLKFRSRMRSAM